VYSSRCNWVYSTTGHVADAALAYAGGVPTPANDPRQEPLADPELCGRFVSWLGAALAARVDPEAAVAAIEFGSDGQVVAGWHDLFADADDVDLVAEIPEIGAEPVELSLAEAFERLLAIDVRRVWLVLPVAGDPLGLSGAGAFALAALEAECGVLVATDRIRLGFIPTTDRRGSSYRGWRWRVYVETVAEAEPLEPLEPPASLESVQSVGSQRAVAQTDRALSRAVRAATEELAALDLAHWRPEVAAGRKEAEAALRAAGQRMPPGWPPPARALAERALALWRIVRVAGADSGAASASGSQARRQALSSLSHAVREAAMAAYNVPVLSWPPAGPSGSVETDLARRSPR
jgi:hypothetical protein